MNKDRVSRSIEKLKNQLDREARLKFSSFVSGGIRNIKTIK